MSGLTHCNCQLKLPERRLSDSLNLWIETKKAYFEPDQFRININNVIQALRSVTFILQKIKLNFPSFDDWYSKWQHNMRADPLMRWLIEARNIIVKEGDLETHSIARVSLVESWFDPPKYEMLVPPFIETEDIARIIANAAPREISWDVGLLRVERRWVDSRIPNHEILDILVYSFKTLSELLFNAHEQLIDEKLRLTCPWFASVNTSMGLLPPCMHSHDWDRTIWVNIRDGSIMVPENLEIKLSSDDLEEAKERYSGLEEMQEEFRKTKDFMDEAAFLFQAAKNILKTDGYHLPLAILGYRDGKRLTVQLHMEDRTEKHLILRSLANVIEKTGAISVILINEAWFSRNPSAIPGRHACDDPQREEILHLIALSENGQQCNYFTIFSRDKNGDVFFGDEFFSTEDTMNILEPIKAAWNRRRRVEKNRKET